MKEHKIEIDLNKISNAQLDMIMDMTNDGEAIKYIMELKAWRNGWMSERREKQFGEKYIY